MLYDFEKQFYGWSSWHQVPRLEMPQIRSLSTGTDYLQAARTNNVELIQSLASAPWARDLLRRERSKLYQWNPSHVASRYLQEPLKNCPNHNRLRFDHYEALETLIEAGVELECKDIRGNTPFLTASESMSLKCWELLSKFSKKRTLSKTPYLRRERGEHEHAQLSAPVYVAPPHPSERVRRDH